MMWTNYNLKRNGTLPKEMALLKNEINKLGLIYIYMYIDT